MNPAPSIDEAASEWVVRHGTTLTPAVQKEFDTWLAQDVRHAEAFARLSKTWRVFDRAEPRGQNAMILQNLGRRARRRFQRRMTAVACLVVLGAITFTTKPWSRFSSEAHSETLTNIVRELPDGSTAELSRGAELDVRFDSEARRITLVKGQAHFRVEKDTKHPFLVRAGDVEVAAVGTAFAVELSTKGVEVVVTEGRVSVDAHATAASGVPRAPASAPTLVDAGNRVTVAAQLASAALQVTPMSPAEVEQRLAWRSSLLEFEGIELTEAAALLNRANELRIRTSDTEVGKLRISGVFRTDNPEGFVRIVSSTFELKVEHPNDRELLLRRP